MRASLSAIPMCQAGQALQKVRTVPVLRSQYISSLATVCPEILIHKEVQASKSAMQKPSPAILSVMRGMWQFTLGMGKLSMPAHPNLVLKSVMRCIGILYLCGGLYKNQELRHKR